MDIRKQRAIEELDHAREDLLNISKHALTYASINNWHTQWNPTFLKAETISGRNVIWLTGQILRGYDSEKDVEVLDALRMEIIEELRTAISLIDSQVKVRTVLEEYTLKVKDRKLSTLLDEFNCIVNIAPNHAAIVFRTILSLIIQERAKRFNSQLKLATTNDLKLKECIDDALKEHIFLKDEERRLTSFAQGGNKDTFDFLVHRPGGNQLVNKGQLNDAVSLLENLLPSIIP